MTICKRIIARIDVKGTKLIKGIQFEGLRVIGNACETAQRYNELGVDEIFYSDAVASLYGRNGLSEILKQTSKGSFIPITAGGGIRSIEDGKKLLANGADKLAINSEAVKNPNLINQLAETFGKQCVVISIQARRSIDRGQWDVMIESGRERSKKDLFEWILEVQKRGAGEIFLTSVDKDGTGKGPDSKLISKVNPIIDIPLVVGGGYSEIAQIKETFKTNTAPSGVSIGWALHNSTLKIKDIKDSLSREGIIIRNIENSKNKNFPSKKLKIAIMDYGMGNVESLRNAFQYIGAEVNITDSFEELEKADLMTIPGVGSFPKGMQNLKEKNFIDIVKKRAQNKSPILGICLGMQLLFSNSKEFGNTNGLNLIKGTVEKLPEKDNFGKMTILPHVGWNKIVLSKDKYLFKKNEEVYQYFVHSFAPKIDTEDKSSVLCETEYSGHKFVSAVKKDNLYGFQFHPERSGIQGLRLLSRILDEIK